MPRTYPCSHSPDPQSCRTAVLHARLCCPQQGTIRGNLTLRLANGTRVGSGCPADACGSSGSGSCTGAHTYWCADACAHGWRGVCLACCWVAAPRVCATGRDLGVADNTRRLCMQPGVRLAPVPLSAKVHRLVDACSHSCIMHSQV